jgi:two-component system, OmpR family, sensor kinase
VASLGSYTRSAARATFSAYRRVPIRWRLAGGSALLTCVILASFAAIVGVMTDRQLRGTFNNEARANADQLAQELHLKWLGEGAYLNCKKQDVSLKDYTSAEHAQIRIFNEAGVLLCTQEDVKVKGVKALPATPELQAPAKAGTYTEGGYFVVAQQLPVPPSSVWLLYARPLSDTDHTVGRTGYRSPRHAPGQTADRGGP